MCAIDSDNHRFAYSQGVVRKDVWGRMQNIRDKRNLGKRDLCSLAIVTSCENASDLNGFFAISYPMLWTCINVVVLPDINHRTWNDAQLDSGQWLWCLVLLHAFLHMRHNRLCFSWARCGVSAHMFLNLVRETQDSRCTLQSLCWNVASWPAPRWRRQLHYHYHHYPYLRMLTMYY